MAAQCSAVMPSPCAPFTSAPLFSMARTAATSPAITASATGCRRRRAQHRHHAEHEARAGTHSHESSHHHQTPSGGHYCAAVVLAAAFKSMGAVLSPKVGRSRPSICPTDSMALAIGVPSAALMCRLPLS